MSCGVDEVFVLYCSKSTGNTSLQTSSCGRRPTNQPEKKSLSVCVVAAVDFPACISVAVEEVAGG